MVAIGDDSFKSNPYLTSVVIPNSVKFIYDEAFENCYNLSSVTLPHELIGFDATVFNNTPFFNNEAKWENGVLYLGAYLLKAQNMSHCSIKEGTKCIADHAFSECESLTSITIPNSVKTIEHDVFFGCSSLTSVIIPNSVTSIGDYAFYNCSSLNSIFIPNSVTSIGNYAFGECTTLTTVTVPSHAKIEKGAFPEYTEVIRY